MKSAAGKPSRPCPSDFNISGVSHVSVGSEPRSAVFSVETIVRQRLAIEFSIGTGALDAAMNEASFIAT